MEINDLELVTLMYLVLGTISMAAVIRSCYPLQLLRIIICTMMALWHLTLGLEIII